MLFVTPEYNRSIPGGLKNAIDWASRPYGKNAITRKPSAVIGASPGRLGTAIAQQHLRSILMYCNSPQLPVEAYVQFTPGLIADDGAIENESTAKFLSKLSRRARGLPRSRLHGAAPRLVNLMRAEAEATRGLR